MTGSNGNLLIVTSDLIPGREIVETLGLVRGSTVRAKHIGSDIVASLRNVIGGEVTEYAQLLAGAREQAIDRMIAEAIAMNADAIVAVRMTTSAIANSSSEVLAYGTAVRLTGH